MTLTLVQRPTARQLRVRLRRARRGHHDRPLGELLTDLYILAWFVLMYGFVLVQAASQYLHPSSGGRADPAERYWIGVAVVVAAAGLAWQALRAVGPLLVTPAAQTWFVSTPVDRRGWLLPRLGALLVGSAAAAAVLALAGDGLGLRPDPGWAALAGAAFGTAGAALGVAAQAAPPAHRWPWRLGIAVLGLAGAVATAVVASHVARVGLSVPTVPVAAVLAVAGLPLAVTATVRAVRALPRLDRATLTAGTQLATAAVTAVTWLDPSLLSGMLEVRRWRKVGRVRSRPFRPWGRAWVLLQADLRRQVRRPTSLVLWGVLVLGQYAAAVAVPSMAAIAHLVGGYLAADRLTGGLRTVCRSPGLRRALGGDEITVRLAHLVVPALGAVAWWLVTVPVGGAPPAVLQVVLVAGVIAAVYRAATRPPMRYGGAVVDTPFGLIPVDLLRQIVRGPDLLAVLIVVQWLLA